MANEVWTNCTEHGCKEKVCSGFDVEYITYNGTFGECLCKDGYGRDLDQETCFELPKCPRASSDEYD